MPPDSRFAEFMRRLRQHDNDAAEELLKEFGPRLRAHARPLLRGRLQQKVAPEDAVQTVYYSFFEGLDEGLFHASSRGELGALLSRMLVRQCIRHTKVFHAQQRALWREVYMNARHPGGHGPHELLAHELTPEEAAVVNELLAKMLEPLDSQERTIMTRFLEGETAAEIAERVGCSKRLVQLIVAKSRKRLEQLCAVKADGYVPARASPTVGAHRSPR
jgi:RNA polymerase sigma factor (sigma-70 family)